MGNQQSGAHGGKGDAVRLRRRGASSVLGANELQSSGTDIARAVYQDQQLHRAAGVAPSQGLNKVASGASGNVGGSYQPKPAAASTPRSPSLNNTGVPKPPQKPMEDEDDVPAWETIAALNETDFFAIKGWIDAGWRCQNCGHIRNDAKSHPHAITLLTECGIHVPKSGGSATFNPGSSPARSSSTSRFNGGASGELDRRDGSSTTSSTGGPGRRTPSEHGSPRFRGEDRGYNPSDDDGSMSSAAAMEAKMRAESGQAAVVDAGKMMGGNEAMARKVLAAISRAHQVYFVDKEPNGSLTFNFLLSALIDITESSFGFISSALVKADGSPYLKTHAMTNVAWTPELREWYQANAHKGLVFTNMNTLHGSIVLTGKMVMTNDVKNDPRSTGIPPGHPELETFLGLPLYTGPELIGIIGLANRQTGYTEEVVRELEPLVSTVSQLMYAINERKRRKDAEMQLTSISQSTHEGILTLSYGGQVTSMNASAITMFGFAPSNEDDPAALPKKLRKLSFPQGLTFSQLMIDAERVEYSGKGLDLLVSREFDTHGVRKDGSSFPIHICMSKSTGDTKFFIAVVRPSASEGATAAAGPGADGGVLSPADAATAAGNELAFLSGGDNGVWDWDLANNRISVDDKWVASLGYRVGEVGQTQEDWDKLMHPDDVDKAYVLLKDHFDGVTDKYVNVRRFLCKNGEYRWFLNSGKVTTRGDNNEPIRFLGTHIDISAVKQAEDIKSASSSKPAIETLLTLQYGVGTPVRRILASSGELKKTELTAEQKKKVDSIYDASESVIQVMDEAINIGKGGEIGGTITATHKESFNILRVLERVALFISPEAEQKGLELLLEVSKDAPTTWYGDAGHLMQLVMLLANSAVENTSRGFVLLQLGTETLPGGDPIVVVRVQDTGSGMSEEKKEDIKSILESDQHVASAENPDKAVYHLWKQLADTLDGTIGFTSEPNRGSTCILKLAIMSASVVAPSKKDMLFIPPVLQGANVLVVGRKQVLISAVDRQLSAWHIGHSVVNASLEQLLMDIYPSGDLPHVMSLGKAGTARPPSKTGERRGLGQDYDILLADVSGMGNLEDDKWKQLKDVMCNEDIGLVFLLGSHQVTLSRKEEIKKYAHWSRTPVFLLKPLIRQQLLLGSLSAALVKPALNSEETAGTVNSDDVSFAGHVLFCKINAMKRRMVKSLMISLGLTVQLGKDGSDTTTLFKKGRYDMVFLQCHLSDLHGWEVCRAIREFEAASGATTSVPVVMLMTNAVEGDLVNCQQARATDFIWKSPNRQMLVDVVKKYLKAE